MVRYWDLIKSKYTQPPGEPHEQNLWLQSIVRYFALNIVVQRSKIQRLVYLDWDTAVFVSSAAAWGVVGPAEVSITTCIYPPFATANHIFAMMTRESCADFALWIASIVLTNVPAGCPFIHGTDMDMIMYYFTYFPTWVDNQPGQEISGVQTLQFADGSEKRYTKEELPNRQSLEEVHWLHFSDRQGAELLTSPACDDSNVLCSKPGSKRWDRFADVHYGRFLPGMCEYLSCVTELAVLCLQLGSFTNRSLECSTYANHSVQATCLLM